MSIESLTEALATVVKELSRRSTIFTDGRLCTYGLQFKAPRLGNGWRVARRINMGRLVQSIGELTRHYGLPTGTRRDYETRHADEENSQFVLLIKELQKHLPKGPRRHDHSIDAPASRSSIDALAQAIYRARKSNGWPGYFSPQPGRGHRAVGKRECSRHTKPKRHVRSNVLV
jgi:hypothetical protein